MSDNIAQHFQLLEACISRMHGASQNCKQACIALVTGVLAVAAAVQLAALGWIAFFPVLAFWFLDAYYLSIERDFIAIFENSADCREAIKPFKFNFPKSRLSRFGKTVCATYSLSTLPFYLVLVLVLSLLVVFAPFKIK